MKIRTVILIFVAFGCFYLWKNPARLERLKTWVHTTVMTSNTPSAADREEELERLRAKLAIDEKMLSGVEAQMERIRANAPSCPLGRATTTFTNDPRPALREKIDQLRAKIRKLEQG